MKQIYIHTMLGTTRIDYDPNKQEDIMINASVCNIDDVFYGHIESYDLDMDDIEWLQTRTNEDPAADLVKAYTDFVVQREKYLALYADESPNEKYLRDLKGDDAYENYESQ